jgi:hypothetical protein
MSTPFDLRKVGVDLEGVVDAPVLRGAALHLRVALAQDDVVLAGGEEHHAGAPRVELEFQAEDLGIELPADLQVADRDAEMHYAFGLDHEGMVTPVSAAARAVA